MPPCQAAFHEPRDAHPQCRTAGNAFYAPVVDMQARITERQPMTQPLTPRELEAEILLWIARLPLALPEDLRRLTGADDDAVGRATEALHRHGWLDRFKLHSLDHGKTLEVPALHSDAIPAFAWTFGLDGVEVRDDWPVDRRDLLDRIASFEVTDSVNRFLANVASDCRRDRVQVVDLRALPQGRRNSAGWPPMMDAYGCLRAVWERPFFVALDRQAVPARHRSARVSAWYEARQHDDWPTILIVTASESEQEQWERAIRTSAYRRGLDPLEVAFTTTKDAFGDRPTDDCWFPSGEDYATSLVDVLRPVRTWPIELPTSPRLDLIDRGVGSHAQTFDEWAWTQTTGTRGSLRERVAALRLTLGARHWRVLIQLARHPYLTARDLVDTTVDEDATVASALTDLVDRELIAALTSERPTHRGRVQIVHRYFVTHAGIELLAAAEGVPTLRYAEHSALAAETSAKGRGGNRLRNLRRNFEHTLGTNAVFVRLARDASQAGHLLPYWWSESEATHRFEYRDRQYWVRPDGAGTYFLGEERHRFLLEYDRGTMRRRDYQRKLTGIAAFFKSGDARAMYGKRLTALVVSETDQGERRFAEAVMEAEQRRHVDLPVLLTTRAHISRDLRGLLGPIWRTPDDPRRRAWLEVPLR